MLHFNLPINLYKQITVYLLPLNSQSLNDSPPNNHYYLH